MLSSSQTAFIPAQLKVYRFKISSAVEHISLSWAIIQKFYLYDYLMNLSFIEICNWLIIIFKKWIITYIVFS